MKKHLFQTLKIITLGLILSAGFALAQVVTQTWISPVGTPPVGNISAPVNTSLFDQVKSGALSVGTLTVLGDSSFNGPQSILGGHSLNVINFVGVGRGMTLPTRNLEIVNEKNPNDPHAEYAKSYLKATSLVHTSDGFVLDEICSNNYGVLSLCVPPMITPIPNPPPGTQIWNSPGSYYFKIPDGMTSVTVETWGAGGGGTGGSKSNGLNSNGMGGGGGTGGSHKTQTYVVGTGGDFPSNAIFTINVGAGGNGGNGEPYDFGSGTWDTSTDGGLSSVKYLITNYLIATGGISSGATQASIGGTNGSPGTSGASGGIGGGDPGCNNAGNPGGIGGIPGGGGGGGSGGRTCSTSSYHSGGSGGNGGSGQVKISWQ